jgi:hypothetical protein
MVILFGFGAIEQLQSSHSTPPVTIGDVEINAVIEVTDRGGVNAPEKRTEQGFSWSSYVDSTALEVSVTAWVEASDYNTLVSLRDDREPVSVSIGQVAIDDAVVDNIEVTNSSQEKSHYEISIEIREVKMSSTDTTTLTVSTGNGQASGSASSERPSFVQSEGDSSGAGEDVQNSGGGGGGGNFISDAIGNAADAVGGLL